MWHAIEIGEIEPHARGLSRVLSPRVSGTGRGSAPAPTSRVGGTYDGASPGGGRGEAGDVSRAQSRFIFSASATAGAPPSVRLMPPVWAPGAFMAWTWAMSFSVKACESLVPIM